MSARAASSALILSLLIAPGFFRPAQAGPWLPARGEYYTELRGGLFTTDTYRDDAGNSWSLGGKWEERSILGTVEFGLLGRKQGRVSVVMSAPLISASATVPTLGSVTSTGLEDLRIGFRYGILRGPTALAFESATQWSLGYDRASSLLAFPERGGGLDKQMGSSLQFGTPIAKRGFLQIGTGLAMTFRDVDYVRSELGNKVLTVRSFVGQTSADLGFWVTRSLLVGARYSGSTTLDSKASWLVWGKPPIDLQPFERTLYLAGPMVVWRVDERLDLAAGSWFTVSAKNSFPCNQVYVALTLKKTSLNRLQGFLGGTKAP